MNIEQAYVGAWFPRTSLHLRELYRFLKDGEGVRGLDVRTVRSHWRSLSARNVSFHEEQELDFVRAACGDIELSLSEDGVMLLKCGLADAKKAIRKLETFYTQKFGPAVSYLFSRGAPLPKVLTSIEDVYPIPLVVKHLSRPEVLQLLATFNDTLVSTVSSADVELYSGTTVVVLNIFQGSLFASEELIEEFVECIVFFREFESQLRSYLELHRSMWDEIANVRESRALRYKDFPTVRERILGFLTSISFVKARLAQMMDIIIAREFAISAELKAQLPRLGLNRFVALQAQQKYVEDLWKMTHEYADGTLGLLNSLFQENTQRELNALKLVTLVAAITSFFGMNIAFPWEERWSGASWSFYIVILLITSVLFVFYYVMRQMIYNRYFTIRSNK